MKTCGHKAKRDKGSNYCHSCYMQGWREKNREKINAYQRERHRWRVKHDPEYAERVAEVSRAGRRRRKYGLSESDYAALLERAKGRCEICGSDGSNGHHGQLCIDHDHETGEVRGLLCDSCNKSLGAVGDRLESIMKFVKYLRTHQGVK